jgi:hypothetical protein
MFRFSYTIFREFTKFMLLICAFVGIIIIIIIIINTTEDYNV